MFDAAQTMALARSDADGLQTMRDLDNLRAFISGSGLVALCDLPWTPLYILVCTLFHPFMGLAVLVGALLLAALTYLAELMTRTPTRDLVGLAASRRTAADTAYHNAELVRALGMQRRMSELWSQRSAAYLDAQRRISDLSGGFGSISRLLRMLLQSAVLALGAWLVINQQATAGVMLAATILSIRALAPIELAIANWRGFIAARESLQRLCNALAALPPAAAVTELPMPTRQLRVAGISLKAPRGDALLLHDASFALQAGSAVAVLGPSGAGKSTLARALVGLIAPLRGSIRLDNAAIEQWDPETLGRATGFLPQDVTLFRGSIAQNIARFAAEPDSAKVIAAATEANVHDMILRLPRGYDTEVGDGGLMLSGGQRQRIALARALYGDPFLVVLDEPNSNLDAEGDQALSRAIENVRARGGIVVVVAHRPTVLRAVDHLLVLNGGRVAAFGRTESVLPLLMPSVSAALAVPAPPAAPKPRTRKARAADLGEAVP